MAYVRNFEDFKKSQQTNEGLLDTLKAATGAVKNFFTGIAQPFKNFKADFQKGLSLEEAKTKVTKSLDELQAASIKSINTAKEKSEILQMQETFMKNIDEQMAQFDKDISTVKESNTINEGKIQDGMIGARVLFGLLKDEYQRLSTEFQKKFANAKDIAAAKTEAINLIKNTVASAKKKISDAKVVDDAITKYKEEKKIVAAPAAKGQIVLDWGDVEATVMPSEEKVGFFQVVSTNSKKLNFKEGQKLFAKLPAEIKKGDKVMMSELERDGNPDPLKQYETGPLEKILVDGKEVPNYKNEGGAGGADAEESIDKSIQQIKNDKEKMAKVSNIVQTLVSKPEKVADVEKILAA